MSPPQGEVWPQLAPLPLPVVCALHPPSAIIIAAHAHRTFAFLSGAKSRQDNTTPITPLPTPEPSQPHFASGSERSGPSRLRKNDSGGIDRDVMDLTFTACVERTPSSPRC